MAGNEAKGSHVRDMLEGEVMCPKLIRRVWAARVWIACGADRGSRGRQPLGGREGKPARYFGNEYEGRLGRSTLTHTHIQAHTHADTNTHIHMQIHAPINLPAAEDRGAETPLGTASELLLQLTLRRFLLAWVVVVTRAK